jgi:hypothetical protein
MVSSWLKKISKFSSRTERVNFAHSSQMLHRSMGYWAVDIWYEINQNVRDRTHMRWSYKQVWLLVLPMHSCKLLLQLTPPPNSGVATSRRAAHNVLSLSQEENEPPPPPNVSAADNFTCPYRTYLSLINFSGHTIYMSVLFRRAKLSFTELQKWN